MPLFSLPTPLIVPRPPAAAGTLDDFKAWAGNLVGYLTSVNFTLDSLGDAFIGSSALVGDDVITTGSIQDSSITSAKILDSSISTIDLANSAVTTIKIQASGVTSASIAAAALYNSHLTSNIIQSANMSASAVYTSAVIYSAITTAAQTTTTAGVALVNGAFTTVATANLTMTTTDQGLVLCGSTIALTNVTGGETIDQQLISSTQTLFTRSGLGLLASVLTVDSAYTLGGMWLGGLFTPTAAGSVGLSYQIRPNATGGLTASASERTMSLLNLKR